MAIEIGILEADGFSEAAIETLTRVGHVSVFDGGDQRSFVVDKEAMFVRLAYSIDAGFLAAATELGYICSPTTGLTHIDMEAAAQRGVEVISLRGESAFLETIRATPEHALGLIIALLRNYKSAFLGPANPGWDRDPLRGREIYGTTVGVVGFGRVGRLLGAYLSRMGARVLFFDTDPTISGDDIAERVDSAAKLCESSEVVVLALSFDNDNRGVIGAECLDHLRGKYLVNISRGEVIDEQHLVDRLDADFFAGVALDVIDNELGTNRLPALLRLAENRNLILTPHIGGATFDSMRRTEEFIADKLVRELGT